MIRAACAGALIDAAFFSQAIACGDMKGPSLGHETVTLQKGTITYPLKSDPHDPDRDNDYKSYCPNNACTCEADVNYVRFKVPPGAEPPGLAAINAALRQTAEDRLCADGIAYGSADEEATWDKPGIVSVRITGSFMGLGGGGSCHGVNDTHTYDTATGEEYLLKDILDDGKIAEARTALIKNIYDSSGDENESLEGSFSMVEDAINLIPDKKFLNFGFYIEKGRVFVNTNKYYFSCAGGNFHPGEIPLQLIKADMRAKLGLTDSTCN